MCLSSINKYFNDLVYIDTFFLDGTRFFHVMHSQSCYSSGALFYEFSLTTSVLSFETVWFAPFWPSAAVQAYKAFKHYNFVVILHDHSIEVRIAPPLRRSITVLESKHCVIRIILIRLLSVADRPIPAFV